LESQKNHFFAIRNFLNSKMNDFWAFRKSKTPKKLFFRYPESQLLSKNYFWGVKKAGSSKNYIVSP